MKAIIGLLLCLLHVTFAPFCPTPNSLVRMVRTISDQLFANKFLHQTQLFYKPPDGRVTEYGVGTIIEDLMVITTRAAEEHYDKRSECFGKFFFSDEISGDVQFYKESIVKYSGDIQPEVTIIVPEKSYPKSRICAVWDEKRHGPINGNASTYATMPDFKHTRIQFPIIFEGDQRDTFKLRGFSGFKPGLPAIKNDILIGIAPMQTVPPGDFTKFVTVTLRTLKKFGYKDPNEEGSRTPTPPKK